MKEGAFFFFSDRFIQKFKTLTKELMQRVIDKASLHGTFVLQRGYMNIKNRRSGFKEYH